MATNRFRVLFDHLEEGIMATLLAFMTCLTFTQVVLRYVFNSGWIWSLEATTYAFGWLVLIGMSYGVRTRAHISVNLFTNKLPERIRRYIALLAVGICLFYSGLMIYGSVVYISKLYVLGNMARDIGLPKWLLTGIMPIAFLLLAIRFFQAGWQIINGEDNEVKLTGGGSFLEKLDKPDKDSRK